MAICGRNDAPLIENVNLPVVTGCPRNHLAFVSLETDPGCVIQEGTAEGGVRVRCALVAEVTMHDVIREQINCVLRQVGRRVRHWIYVLGVGEPCKTTSLTGRIVGREQDVGLATRNGVEKVLALARVIEWSGELGQRGRARVGEGAQEAVQERGIGILSDDGRGRAQEGQKLLDHDVHARGRGVRRSWT